MAMETPGVHREKVNCQEKQNSEASSNHSHDLSGHCVRNSAKLSG
jgi:hypothetical protein